MSEKKRKTVTINLEYPVETQDGLITEITLRRPKARDVVMIEAAADSAKGEQALATLSILSDLPVEVIGELDIDDFTAASEVIADFFPQAKA